MAITSETNHHTAGQPTPDGELVLPTAAYTDQDWFDREMEIIFGRCWNLAGLVEDVREPGEYITTQVGNYPLFVVMNEARELRAFHNICRHRGTQLLRTAGKAKKVITCPYHDWAYTLDGALASVPERQTEFPDLDIRTIQLQPASVAVWRSMIFVHPDPHALSIDHWFRDIEPYLGPHQPETLPEYTKGRQRHEINANWKIIVENFMDGYHLAHLHSATLGNYHHAKQETRYVGPHFMFYEPLSPNYLNNLEKLSRIPLIKHIPQEKIGAYVPMLFPTIGLAETESIWSTFHIQPIAPDKSIVELRVRVEEATAWEMTKQSIVSWWHTPRRRTKYGTGDASDPMESGDFMKEDIWVCEQQQSAMNSPRFGISATAQHLEQSVVGYRERVRDFMRHGYYPGYEPPREVEGASNGQ